MQNGDGQPGCQLSLPGVPPPSHAQGRFVAAAQYASLTLQVCEHLFPGKKLYDLSPDQRRMLINETEILLLQARWRVECHAFAEHFAIPQAGVEMAPPGTVLGEPPPALRAEVKSPGQYL